MTNKDKKAAGSKNIHAASNATIGAAMAKGGNAEVITTVAAATKADKAREVFTAAYAQTPVPQRKDIIAQAMQVASLTKAGAATYLQNFKAKAGLSTKRVAATA